MATCGMMLYYKEFDFYFFGKKFKVSAILGHCDVFSCCIAAFVTSNVENVL